MKRNIFCFIVLGLFLIACKSEKSERDHCEYNQYVNKFMGTGSNGRVSPVASIPFGMMQLAPDTRPSGSGYHYTDSMILGFSHLHKSGGGCADFQDILFLPLSLKNQYENASKIGSHDYQASFSHAEERSTPGYYSVDLYEGELTAELTATRRCGIQRYTYSSDNVAPLLVDLAHGSQCACTIEPGHDVDTVYASFLEQIDPYTIRGFRKSNGWAYQQQIYFYTTFSKPIRKATFYVDNMRQDGITFAEGCNLKLLLTFEEEGKVLDIKTGISFVDMDGARKNLQEEAQKKSFDTIRKEAANSWEKLLGQIEVETQDMKKKKMFYTSLHNVMLYPMLSSDLDYRFRGPDAEIHTTDGFDYYGAVIGLWVGCSIKCSPLSTKS